MSRVVLTLKQAPALRVDARGLNPAAMAGLARAQIERLVVGHGNQMLPLAEFFSVSEAGEGDELTFEGDLSRVDRIGWQLGVGRIVVEGAVGDYVGGGMTAGEVVVKGDAGALAACEMAGGSLTIEGDVGDFAASTLPGSMDGMRGGSFIVRGDAGARFGDRMRRGSAIVFGRVGDFAASRMVAGTIAVGGGTGAHVGYGMRRGSVVFAGTAGPPAIDPTFVPALAAAPVIWQLLARDLARHGGPFVGLASRRIVRHLGDVGAAGKGELILVR
jgi:formylmethanofuran dehydrogenase subunit C